jgi:hypothetical protein
MAVFDANVGKVGYRGIVPVPLFYSNHDKRAVNNDIIIFFKASCYNEDDSSQTIVTTNGIGN